MSASTRPRTLLAGALIVLLVAVGADQLGLMPGRGGDPTDADGAGASLRERYLARARRTAETERLISEASNWQGAASQAREAWASARARLVVAKTAELAEAAARDRVLDALKDLNLGATRATVVAAPAAEVSGPVRAITLDVRFDTPNHRDAYAAVDRLDHLTGLTATVTGLRLEGPGRPQTPPSIAVALTVQVLAAVGQED